MVQATRRRHFALRHALLAGGLGAVVATLAASHAAEPGLLSKRYEFRAGALLEIGAAGPEGLRLDSVRFKVPKPTGDRLARTSGVVSARVAVSNTAARARKVGLAIALFDAENRLLGVAHGGNKLVMVKAGRQKTFELLFQGVSAEAHKSTAFQISLEAKR